MPALPTIEVSKLNLLADAESVGALDDMVRASERAAREVLRSVDWNTVREVQERAGAMLSQLNEPAMRMHAAVTGTDRAVTNTLQKTVETVRALEDRGTLRIREQVELAGETMRRIREQSAELFRATEKVAEVGRLIDASWSQTARVLAQQFVLAERQIDRRVAKLLFARGWIGVERHLGTWEMARFLEVKGRNKGAAIDRGICAAFRRKRQAKLKAMVRNWASVPYLHERRLIVRQAIDAHVKRKYALSIAALLPLVEGCAAEIRRTTPTVSPTGKTTVRSGPTVGEVVVLYDTGGKARDWADAVVDAVSKRVFAFYKFGAQRPPSKLNRHGILHGRIADYPSEVNSLRALLLVDVVAHIARNNP